MDSTDSHKLPILDQQPAGAYTPPEIKGWTTRSTTDEPRLSELVGLYEELGFEVMVRPISVEEDDGSCAACVMDHPERYGTIYTRPRIED
jgi:hypothetical protein